MVCVDVHQVLLKILWSGEQLETARAAELGAEIEVVC